jgi:hypothetical protein
VESAENMADQEKMVTVVLHEKRTPVLVLRPLLQDQVREVFLRLALDHLSLLEIVHEVFNPLQPRQDLSVHILIHALLLIEDRTNVQLERLDPHVEKVPGKVEDMRALDTKVVALKVPVQPSIGRALEEKKGPLVQGPMGALVLLQVALEGVKLGLIFVPVQFLQKRVARNLFVSLDRLDIVRKKVLLMVKRVSAQKA